MAWKNAAYAAGDCSLASAKDRTGSVRPRNTENRLPASDSQNGTPAAASAADASLATASAAASTRAYTSGVQDAQRGQPGRDRQRVTRQRARLVDRPGRAPAAT